MQSKCKFYFFFLLFFFCIIKSFGQTDYTTFVNPFIGTGGHGHTFPGATVPFGMVQLSPDTRIDGSWDGCSGYHYDDSLVYGFSHTHLSGTGVSDYGDILLLPMVKEPTLSEEKNYDFFSHKDEKASPGYYSIKLKENNINVALTATTRVGFHKYVFSKKGQGYVYLDLLHRDKLISSDIKIVNDSTLQVFRQSEGWAKDQRVYAQIVFSKRFNYSKVVAKQKAFFNFDVEPNEPLMVKVSLSAVDDEGAQKNMLLELPDWNFEAVVADARVKWNDELGKINITTSNTDQKTIFYTALYHCLIQPNIYNDVDGRYRGRDMQIHQTDRDYYTVFSLWDTFRAWHPLMAILDPKRTSDFIHTFLLQYEQGGLLPVWELASNETECMIGYHAVSVIADAMLKGISGFDYEKAFEACKKSAEAGNRYGLDAYMGKGFIEVEDESESVSKTLEYAYDDWCIAQMAKLLNKERDYQNYLDRSRSWKNLFNPTIGFIQPRTNGGWKKSFDPYEVDNNYTEANGWQYNFFVPHDVEGLLNITGGRAVFEKKLDALFNASTKTRGREQSDITGLIGQYAHGNEPSHHIAYLYNYVDKPWKTQKIVNSILNDFYKNAPDGLIGNEDCGQMSAWYVMSALGFYQVAPASNIFDITTPLFEKSIIRLNDSATITINVKNRSVKNIFLSAIGNKKISGRNSVQIGIDYFQRTNVLSLNADSSAPKPTIKSPHAYPDTSTFLQPPVINADAVVFKDSLRIKLQAFNTDAKIIYMVQGPFERPAKLTYKKPFYIHQSVTIHAYTVNGNNQESKWVKAEFVKMPHPKWKVKLNATYNPQYNAGGSTGLIDGLHGDENWRKGRWQGYQAQDFECVIDMMRMENIQQLTATFLQDTRAWIIFPAEVVFEISDNGKIFTPAGKLLNDVPADSMDVQIKKFELRLPSELKTRYIKVKAKNFGKLPEWHQGFPMQGDAFIFIDEINVQ